MKEKWKNKNRNGIRCLLTLFLMLTLLLIPSMDTQAATMKLSKTTLELTVGKTKTLKVKNATGKVKWSSSKKSVATVNSSGKVTAVAAGTAKIKAKVGNKTLTCKVTVKNADASATSLTFTTKSGGDFVQGTSAVVKFTLNYTSTKVKVKYQTTSGKTVYTETLSKCKANKTYTCTWTGKTSSGSYAAAGTYKVVVTAGSISTASSGTLTLYTQEFAGGNGSESSPYQVSTLSQLTKVTKHNGCYFVQTKDINGGSANFAPLFTSDNPFTGTYDGKGYTISNLYFRRVGDTGIFTAIGSGGTVQNLNVKDCHVVTDDDGLRYYSYGFIAGTNAGTISNCQVSNCDMLQQNWGMRKGGICGTNTGLVEGCKTYSLKMSLNSYTNNSSCTAGIAGINERGATITDCVCTDFTTTANGGWRAGGIASASYYGSTISNCSTEGTFTVNGSFNYCGTIVGYANSCTISGCYDLTGSSYKLVGVNYHSTVS